jgi:hypothetical protein
MAMEMYFHRQQFGDKLWLSSPKLWQETCFEIMLLCSLIFGNWMYAKILSPLW